MSSQKSARSLSSSSGAQSLGRFVVRRLLVEAPIEGPVQRSIRVGRSERLPRGDELILRVLLVPGRARRRRRASNCGTVRGKRGKRRRCAMPRAWPEQPGGAARASGSPVRRAPRRSSRRLGRRGRRGGPEGKGEAAPDRSRRQPPLAPRSGSARSDQPSRRQREQRKPRPIASCTTVSWASGK